MTININPYNDVDLHQVSSRFYTLGIIQNYDKNYSIIIGTLNLITSNPGLVTGVADVVDTPTCRKDTSQAKKLRKWSRGHQFVVRAGGHIDTWQPLYK